MNTSGTVGVGTGAILYSIVKLCGEVVIGDKGITWWEVIALEAEGADLDLGGQVDDAKGVEDGATHAATEWEVREDGHGG